MPRGEEPHLELQYLKNREASEAVVLFQVEPLRALARDDMSSLGKVLNE